MAPKQDKPKKQTEMADALLLANRKTFGDAAFVSSSTVLEGMYGMPLYRNLPLQYIVGLTCLPLGKFYNVRGEPGSTKSTLVCYMQALDRLFNGFDYYLETENKLNPFTIKAMSKSVCDQPDPVFDLRLQFSPCQNLEEVFARLSGIINNARAMDLINRQQAVTAAIDSMSNINSAEADAVISNFAESEKQLTRWYEGKIEADKITAQRGYMEMHKASKIATNLKGVGGHHISDIPIAIFIVNHATLVQEDGGPKSFAPKTYTNAGGKHQHFQYSMTFELKKAAHLQEATDSQKFPYIDISGAKSCFTFTGNRKIRVPLITKQVPDDKGGWRTMQIYDWDHSLALLLTDKFSALTCDQDTMLHKVLPSLKVEGARYSCAELGLVEVTGRQLGRAIHDRPKLCARLCHEVLAIETIKPFGVLQHEWDRVRASSEACDHNYANEAVVQPFSLDDDEPVAVPGPVAVASVHVDATPAPKRGNKAAAVGHGSVIPGFSPPAPPVPKGQAAKLVPPEIGTPNLSL